MASSCERGKEPSGSITFGELLDWLRNCQLLNNNSAPWIELINNFIFFLLGDSPESEFYMPTFRTTLFYLYMPIKKGQCSETSAHNIQAPGNHPKKIQHSEHGESSKSS